MSHQCLRRVGGRFVFTSKQIQTTTTAFLIVLVHLPCNRSLGQKSCRTKVSRIFRIFVPNFAPNLAPNFPRIFRGLFVLRFVGDGDQKKFTKNPRHFSMQNSQANTKKIFTKFFWRAGKEIGRETSTSRLHNTTCDSQSPPISSLQLVTKCQGAVKGVYLKGLFAKSRLFYREMDCPVRFHREMECPVQWSLATPSALESQSRANKGSVVANPICKCRRHKAGHLQV